jgi:hypothetical protein
LNDPEGLIVFTSVSDDFYGGDTNNDGSATAPNSTRWGRIIIENEVIDDSTRMSNAVFRYGYNSATYGTIEISSANPEIDNCVFSHNGIAIDYVGTAGDPTEGWIHDSDFYGNTYYAVRNTGTAFTVDATGNWWGHASGPLDVSDDTGSGGFYNPSGLGDAVGDRVDYGSWLIDGIENLLLGDVSRNSDIRAYDASLVLQHVVAPFLGPLQLVLGDVNCLGGPNAMDAALILRFVAGLDSYFPCAFESVITKEAGPVVAKTESTVGAEPITFELGLPATTIGAGESAWVPIELTGSGELYGQEYHIAFDAAKVSVSAVRLLPAAEGSMLAWNVDGSVLRIALASALPLDVADAVEFEVTGSDGLTGAEALDLSVVFARLNDQEYNSASDTPDGPSAIRSVRLLQNHPNPFNPVTAIRYELPGTDAGVPVRLVVYDTRGHIVRELVNEVQTPGPYEVIWDGRDTAGRRVGSGVFLYKLDAAEVSRVRKMVLLK